MTAASTSPSVRPLHIHKAIFHDQDVTATVRKAAVRTSSIPHDALSLNTHNLTSYFGDPAPGTRKQLSIIYSYGERRQELAATLEYSGRLTLSHHAPLDAARAQFLQSDPKSKILAVVWGHGNALIGVKGRSTELKLKEIEVEGRFEATSKWMGFDPNPGVPKIAVAYYRLPDGGIGYTTAMEMDTCRLPWNPLAKDFA